MNWLYITLIGLGTGVVMKDRGSSIVSSLVISTIGAILGGLLIELAGKSVYGNTGLLITAFLGAAIFISLKRVFGSSF